MATRVGKLLGRYQINAKIGRGSMGVVYRARDPQINRMVAIKTVSLSGLEPDAEREYRERFVIEAQAAGRLSHPGIVTVFDVAEDPETRAPYLVMEYVDGKSLGQILSGENKRLPLDSALQLAQEVAEALNYAHAQGVVHRDIKPTNILVTADGHAKIADFGIAKLNQTQLTQHGRVLGSPAYMAPEQLSDEGGDARSDLFSLGVVLYFMLTGQRPFQGNSIATVCFKLANHEPLAVANYDMSFPPALDVVVSRAIAKNPAQRYQSGAEMARDIQRLRESCSPVQTMALKQNGITYPPTESERNAPSSESTSHPTSSAGVRVANTGLPSLALTRNRVFALALVAAAVIFVISSRTYNIDPPPPPLPPNTPVLAQPVDKPVPNRPANAELDLEIEHPFTEARASLWLDSQLVYTQVLHADLKNHLLVFRKAQGHEFHRLELKSGKHQVRVRVQSQGTTYDQSRTLDINFAPRGEKTLLVNCDGKHNLLQVILQ
jgi:serine/threonine protein kinase